MALVSRLLGATAIGVLIGDLFKTDPVANWFKGHPSYFSKDGTEGIITLLVIIFVFGWMYYLQTRKDD